MKATARILVTLFVTLFISLSLVDHSPATKAAPLDLSGEIHGAPYRIRVPQTWNGTLLIFAHGYRDKADHPGEVDNRNADVAPSAALEAPLLDPLLVVANDSAYAELNASRGREELLFQTFTTGVGHCNLTGPQILTGVNAIDLWVRTGVRPTSAMFPAALGFNQAFVPPPF
jgi:hypothetical protein